MELTHIRLARHDGGTNVWATPQPRECWVDTDAGRLQLEVRGVVFPDGRERPLEFRDLDALHRAGNLLWERLSLGRPLFGLDAQLCASPVRAARDLLAAPDAPYPGPAGDAGEAELIQVAFEGDGPDDDRVTYELLAPSLAAAPAAVRRPFAWHNRVLPYRTYPLRGGRRGMPVDAELRVLVVVGCDGVRVTDRHAKQVHGLAAEISALAPHGGGAGVRHVVRVLEARDGSEVAAAIREGPGDGSGWNVVAYLGHVDCRPSGRLAPEPTMSCARSAMPATEFVNACRDAEDLKCVLATGCRTSQVLAPALVDAGVACVVGMQFEFDSGCGVRFLSELLRTLAGDGPCYGRVKESFVVARNALERHQRVIPTLHLAGGGHTLLTRDAGRVRRIRYARAVRHRCRRVELPLRSHFADGASVPHAELTPGLYQARDLAVEYLEPAEVPAAGGEAGSKHGVGARIAWVKRREPLPGGEAALAERLRGPERPSLSLVAPAGDGKTNIARGLVARMAAAFLREVGPAACDRRPDDHPPGVPGSGVPNAAPLPALPVLCDLRDGAGPDPHALVVAHAVGATPGLDAADISPGEVVAIFDGLDEPAAGGASAAAWARSFGPGGSMDGFASMIITRPEKLAAEYGWSDFPHFTGHHRPPRRIVPEPWTGRNAALLAAAWPQAHLRTRDALLAGLELAPGLRRLATVSPLMTTLLCMTADDLAAADTSASELAESLRQVDEPSLFERGLLLQLRRRGAYGVGGNPHAALDDLAALAAAAFLEPRQELAWPPRPGPAAATMPDAARVATYQERSGLLSAGTSIKFHQMRFAEYLAARKLALEVNRAGLAGAVVALSQDGSLRLVPVADLVVTLASDSGRHGRVLELFAAMLDDGRPLLALLAPVRIAAAGVRDDLLRHRLVAAALCAARLRPAVRACVRDEIDAIATDMLRLWWACLDEFSAAGVGDESVRPLTDALVALLHAGAEFRGLGRLRFKDPGGLRARLLGRTPKHSGLASWLAESLRRKYVRRESNGPLVFGARLLGRALTGRSAPAQFYDRACDAVAALGEGLRGEPRLAAALREQYGRDAIFPTSRAIASLEPDGEFAAWRSVRRGAEEGGAPEPTTPATDACVPGSPMNFFKASYSGWALDELSKGFVGHNVEQAVRWRAFDREELPGVIAALTAAVRRPSWPRNDSFWALRSLVALGGEAVQPQVLRALAELARGLTDDERSFPGVFPIRSGPREFLALPRMLLTALKPMKVPEAIRTAVADAAAARPHAPAEPGTNGDGFHGIRSFAGRCWNFAVHEDNHHALLLRFVEAAGPEIDREARGTAPSADAATLRQRVLADLIGDHAALFRAEAAMAATRLPSLLENPKVVDAIIEVMLGARSPSRRDAGRVGPQGRKVLRRLADSGIRVFAGPLGRLTWARVTTRVPDLEPGPAARRPVSGWWAWPWQGEGTRSQVATAFVLGAAAFALGLLCRPMPDDPHSLASAGTRSLLWGSTAFTAASLCWNLSRRARWGGVAVAVGVVVVLTPLLVVTQPDSGAHQGRPDGHARHADAPADDSRGGGRPHR